MAKSKKTATTLKPTEPVTAANVFDSGRPMRQVLDYFRERIADIEYEQRHGLPSPASDDEMSPAFRLKLYKMVYADLNAQNDRRF